MQELSLIIQTICLESAIGIMLFLALSRFWDRQASGALATVLACFLTLVALIVSPAHLGKPFRALNSLLNLGSSWLSRETVFVGLFAALCFICLLMLLLSLWFPVQKPKQILAERVTALVGLVLLFVMGSIYTSTSVPVWQGVYTYIENYTSAIILGGVIFFAAAYGHQNRRSRLILTAAILSALTIQVVGSVIHTAGLAQAGAAAAISASILDSYGVWIALKWIFLALGVGGFCLAGTSRPMSLSLASGTPNKAIALIGLSEHKLAWMAVVSVFVSAFIARVLFFSSMVVTNVGM